MSNYDDIRKIVNRMNENGEEKEGYVAKKNLRVIEESDEKLVPDKVVISENKKKINYTVVCVNEFAYRFNLDAKTAFRYLSDYKGIEFIKEHYDIEHTLSLDDAVEDLVRVCRNNGGGY